MNESGSLLESVFAAGDAGDTDAFSKFMHDDVIVHAPAGLSTRGLGREFRINQAVFAHVRDGKSYGRSSMWTRCASSCTASDRVPA